MSQPAYIVFLNFSHSNAKHNTHWLVLHFVFVMLHVMSFPINLTFSLKYQFCILFMAARVEVELQWQIYELKRQLVVAEEKTKLVPDVWSLETGNALINKWKSFGEWFCIEHMLSIPLGDLHKYLKLQSHSFWLLLKKTYHTWQTQFRKKKSVIHSCVKAIWWTQSIIHQVFERTQCGCGVVLFICE